MEGVDYERCLTPVVKFLSIEILVAMVVDHEQGLHLINVNVAFLKQRLRKGLHVT